MNLLKIILLYLSLYLLSSCTTRDDSVSTVMVNGTKVTVCDLTKVSSQEDVLLSELVNNFEVIHLENIDSAFFKPWVTTITDNYIGIRQRDGAPFKLFNRKGKYLRDIGKVGNGPGEYSINLYDEIIDEKTNRIYFTSFLGQKIMVYGLDGKHIKDIPLPFRVQKAKIQLTPEGNIMVAHMPFNEDRAFAFIINMDGNILKEITPREDMRVMNFDSELFSYRNTSNFDIYHTALDTLYHLNTNSLELTPVFTASGREEGWLCVYHELPDRYLLNLFSFKTNEGKVVNIKKSNKTSSQVKLLNDYLGKLEMDFSFNKGYFIENIEPEVLIEKINKHLKNSIPAEDKETLMTLLNTLDENSNNVLIVGKLKQ